MGYWADKRVVVTGGAGFVGTHVVEKLREAGCRHIRVVRHAECDLTKEEAVARMFSSLDNGEDGWPKAASGRRSSADVVIHLAGLVGGIGANKSRPAEFFYENIMMGVLTMHYSWRAGVEKFVAAGAGCGYPEHAAMPLKEESFWDGLPQLESAPYSLAKRMLHVQSIAYWRQHGFPSIVAIPGNIYGPYDNFDLEGAHVIPALVRKVVEAVERKAPSIEAWGSGRPTRDFVYAGDVAEGILKAAEVYDQPELVNLSSGMESSIREVVEILVTITGFRGKIVWDSSRPDGQLRRCFDITKAHRDLQWIASTGLREGLTRTVEWYQRNKKSARNTMQWR
jgi:GDP-L-fucose synthase